MSNLARKLKFEPFRSEAYDPRPLAKAPPPPPVEVDASCVEEAEVEVRADLRWLGMLLCAISAATTVGLIGLLVSALT
jgi:hypothetical protein